MMVYKIEIMPTNLKYNFFVHFESRIRIQGNKLWILIPAKYHISINPFTPVTSNRDYQLYLCNLKFLFCYYLYFKWLNCYRNGSGYPTRRLPPALRPVQKETNSEGDGNPVQEISKGLPETHTAVQRIDRLYFI